MMLLKSSLLIGFFLIIVGFEPSIADQLYPEYGGKKAVMMTLVDYQFRDGTQQNEKFGFYIDLAAYALTRSDVYIGINEKLYNSTNQITEVNLNHPSGKIYLKIPFEFEYYSKLRIFLESVNQKFKTAIQEVGGKPHRIYIFSTKNPLPYIRDMAPVPVKTDQGNLRFIGDYKSTNSDLDSYIFNFISATDLNKIETIPTHIQPSQFTIDEENLFLTNKIPIVEQKVDQNASILLDRMPGETLGLDGFSNLLRSFFSFERSIFLTPHPLETTGHLDTLLKLVKNHKNETIALLSSYNQQNLYYTHDQDGKASPHHQREVKERGAHNQIDKNNISRLNSYQYQVIELPIAGFYTSDKTPYTFNYTNSVILDDLVLVPQYKTGSKTPTINQQQLSQSNLTAIKIYQRYFNHVVGITVPPLGGALHCLTTDIPEF
jgi:hypothetical protein